MSDKIELHIDKVEVVTDDYDYAEEHIKKMSALYNGKSAFENFKMGREINRKFIKHVLKQRGCKKSPIKNSHDGTGW